MDNNNPYKRSFKTKREEYQEKLMQKNSNQDWIFGNYFGKPGGGAPLRDNEGNIISSLKSISNNNIYKYDAQDFSKGDNNISVLNHKIYNKNNIISNPYSLYDEQNNQFQINQNNLFQNREISSVNNENLNNIRKNQAFDYLNLLNYNNINNNNVLFQQQIPKNYIVAYPNIIPYNQISSFPLQTQNNNLYNTFIPNFNYRNSNSQQQTQMYRNYSAIKPQVNYLNNFQNNNKNNLNNINKQENIINNKTTGNLQNNNNEKENDFLLISNDNDLNNKKQNEKKLEDWKNDLRKQVEEKKKRDAEAKREMELKEEEEKIKYQEYLEYKNRQAEEQAKKNKLKKQKYLNKNITNNELEQSQQTISDIQNKNNEMENPYNENNPLNEINVPPEVVKEQEKFKNYIDQQYDSLGQSLGQTIQNEIAKMSSMLTNKYEPIEKSDNFNNIRKFSKFSNETAVRNYKRMQKIQDIIEERELLDFIIDRDNDFTPFKYKNYDINKYNRINSENPSFFGKNKTPYERKFVNLESDSIFIFGDFSENNKIETKEFKSVFTQEEYEKERHKQNNYYNGNINRSGKLGIKIDNLENKDSIAVSQSLDNKTSFVPINNDIDHNMIEKINQNINEVKEQKVKEVKEENKNNEIQLPDKVEDNILKNLNEISLLNKNVILYDIDKNIVQNNIKQNENENKEEKLNIIEKINRDEQKNNNINNNNIEEEKESNIKMKENKIEESNIIDNNEEQKINLYAQKEILNEQKEENEHKEDNNEQKNDNNEQNKKVNEIGVQSEQNKLINNNKDDFEDIELKVHLNNYKEKTIETGGKNNNENTITNKENLKEKNQNNQNNEKNENFNSQDNNEQEEESYEESGEEEEDE